jgi:hypothetical protein
VAVATSARREHALRAKRAFRLIVRRGGIAPALLANPSRVDHVEIVEVDSGEVALFWDCAPQTASRLARALRADLTHLEDDEFVERWSGVEP